MRNIRFSLSRFIKDVKLYSVDKRRIRKLKTIVENGNKNAANDYLKQLLFKTKTDRFPLAYALTVERFKKPQEYTPVLDEFIFLTGSNEGHGRHSSEFSPILWLNYINANKFECCFIINACSFIKFPVNLELEIEQDGCFHSIEGIKYENLPSSSPNCFRYLIRIHSGNINNKQQVSFPLYMEKSCKVRIYHRLSGKTKNLILEETFGKQ